MRIAQIHPQPHWVLSVVADDGRAGNFDVAPYLKYEAFEALKDRAEFLKVFNQSLPRLQRQRADASHVATRINGRGNQHRGQGGEGRQAPKTNRVAPHVQ